MHKYPCHGPSEERLLHAIDGILPEQSIGNELTRKKITTETRHALEGLRQTVGTPLGTPELSQKATTQTLRALEGKLVTTGFAALNIALFTGIFVAGFSTILGKPPPWLRHFLGQKT